MAHISRHCNFEDVNVINLQGIVNGMNISAKIDKSMIDCNTCMERKFVNKRNRGPHVRAIKLLEMIHTDLAGPINPVSKEGLKYCIVFTDDYSRIVILYFGKNKSDILQATGKFLASYSPYGQVHKVRRVRIYE